MHKLFVVISLLYLVFSAVPGATAVAVAVAVAIAAGVRERFHQKFPRISPERRIGAPLKRGQPQLSLPTSQDVGTLSARGSRKLCEKLRRPPVFCPQNDQEALRGFAETTNPHKNFGCGQMGSTLMVPLQK